MAAASGASEEEDFLGRVQSSLLEEQTFVRLTLTNGNSKGKQQQQQPAGQEQPQPPQPPVDKLLARLIEGGGVGSAPRVQITYTHPTSTTTQTLAREEAPAAVAQCIQTAVASGRFKASRLFTTQGDWVLEKGKGGLRLYRNKATFTEVEVGEHDRAKKRRLAMPGVGEEGGVRVKGGSGFMEAYGILDARGQPKKGMRDKHRQIEKFVEILETQLKLWDSSSNSDGGDAQTGPRRRLRLLDAGCGRGLLTFAAYEYLTSRGYDVEARGVDIRPDVVAKANAVAESLGYSPGLAFVQGSIAGLAAEAEAEANGYDVVLALHACDTATDDALHMAMHVGAGVVLASPCCHKEVRREMKRSMKEEGSQATAAAVGLASQAAVLRHGILLERTAEIVTDSLRVLCLETQGYRAQVMEWINDEVTSKNLMLVATKKKRTEQQARAKAVKQLQGLMAHWGLRTQHLVRLLGLLPPDGDSDDG